MTLRNISVFFLALTWVELILAIVVGRPIVRSFVACIFLLLNSIAFAMLALLWGLA